MMYPARLLGGLVEHFLDKKDKPEKVPRPAQIRRQRRLYRTAELRNRKDGCGIGLRCMPAVA